MHVADIAKLTPYPDVNDILVMLTQGISDDLVDQLVGLYLTGSLTYGDFDPGSSDVDYLAVMTAPLTSDQRLELAALHAEIGNRYPVWAERIEGSFVTEDMLPSVLPPLQGRPYVNQGAFWSPDPPYGNEWILNLYVLQECGIALVGPAPTRLIGPVAIDDVREASKRDLLDERVPTLDDPVMYDDPHQQAYTILTLCRILHRAQNDGVASKRVASTWVKERYGEPWRSLVERAEHWQHGESLATAEETKAFIAFARDEVE